MYSPGYISEDDEETRGLLPARKSPPKPYSRPCRNPETFNGKTSWKDYWVHFQTIWDLNGWSKDEAAKHLSSSLRDGAVKVLNARPLDGFGNERPCTLNELKERLERRYGPGELAESFLAQLKARRRHAKETLPELAENIRELVSQAYPEAPQGFSERLAVVHFKDALLDADIRFAVHRAKPNDLDAAVLAAVEAESYLRIEQQRERPGYARATASTDTEQRLLKIEESQNQLAEMFKQLMSQSLQPRQPRQPIQCYGCRQYGHIARFCPQQIPKAQGNISGSTQRSGGRPGPQDHAPQVYQQNQQGFQPYHGQVYPPQSGRQSQPPSHQSQPPHPQNQQPFTQQ